MKTFQDLLVWRKAHEVVLEVYKLTRKFPQEEKFGIVAQMRRSASSIPANIIEGFKRKSRKDFTHFLNIADASLEETKYHLILAKDLAYIRPAAYEKLYYQCEEAGRMLCGLQKKVGAGNVNA